MLEKNNKMISEITELVTKVKSELANEINQSYLYIGILGKLLYLMKVNIIIDQNMGKKFLKVYLMNLLNILEKDIQYLI